MDSDVYKTIKSSSGGIYKEKGSRFISVAIPVSNVDEIKPILDKIKKDYHDARHHCFAYMIGHERNNWRVNDDGEPSGTAGRPILGQINSFGLTNVLVVVSRYFGGTLLGVSGLINAYKSAAASAILNAEFTEQTVKEYYEIGYSYLQMKDVMKILKEENTGQSAQAFDLECRITIDFRITAKERVLSRLARIDGITIRYIETR
jgi:uncharacterized YigZ family protein